MKVGIVASDTFPLGGDRPSGREKVVEFIIDELLCRDHQVYVLCKEGSRSKAEMVYYVESILLPEHNPMMAEVGNVMASMSALLDYELDVIHNHSENPLILILGNQLEVPFVSTFHHMYSKYISYSLKSLKLEYNQSFTASTNRIAESFSSILPDMKVVKKGVRLDQWKYFETSEENYLSWTGRILEDHGLKEVINACIDLGKPLRFAGPIVNQEFYDSEIKPLVQQSGIIHYMGLLDQKLANKMVGRSKAYISTKLNPFSYGLSVIEALSCAVPVLSIENGVSSEDINDIVGQSFAIDNVQSFEAALYKISQIDRQAILSFAQNYCCHKKMVDQYENLYFNSQPNQSVAV